MEGWNANDSGHVSGPESGNLQRAFLYAHFHFRQVKDENSAEHFRRFTMRMSRAPISLSTQIPVPTSPP